MGNTPIQKTGEDYALQAMMSVEVTRRIRRAIGAGVFLGSLPFVLLAAGAFVYAAVVLSDAPKRAGGIAASGITAADLVGVKAAIAEAVATANGRTSQTILDVEQRWTLRESERVLAMERAAVERAEEVRRVERERREDDQRVALVKSIVELCNDKGYAVPDDLDRMPLRELVEKYGQQADEHPRRKKILRALDVLHLDRTYVETAPIAAVEARANDEARKLAHRSGQKLPTDAEVFGVKKAGG